MVSITVVKKEHDYVAMFCGSKGLRTNQRGASKAEAMRNMLNYLEKQYEQLKGVDQDFLNKYGVTRRDDLAPLFNPIPIRKSKRILKCSPSFQ